MIVNRVVGTPRDADGHSELTVEFSSTTTVGHALKCVANPTNIAAVICGASTVEELEQRMKYAYAPGTWTITSLEGKRND